MSSVTLNHVACRYFPVIWKDRVGSWSYSATSRNTVRKDWMETDRISCNLINKFPLVSCDLKRPSGELVLHARHLLPLKDWMKSDRISYHLINKFIIHLIDLTNLLTSNLNLRTWNLTNILILRGKHRLRKIFTKSITKEVKILKTYISKIKDTTAVIISF